MISTGPDRAETILVDDFVELGLKTNRDIQERHLSNIQSPNDSMKQ